MNTWNTFRLFWVAMGRVVDHHFKGIDEADCILLGPDWKRRGSHIWRVLGPCGYRCNGIFIHRYVSGRASCHDRQSKSPNLKPLLSHDGGNHVVAYVQSFELSVRGMNTDQSLRPILSTWMICTSVIIMGKDSILYTQYEQTSSSL